MNVSTKRLLLLLIILFSFGLAVSPALGQQPDEQVRSLLKEVDRPFEAAPAPDPLAETEREWVLATAAHRLYFVIGIMAVTIISLSLILFVLYKRNASAREIVNGSGLVLVIFGVVILMIVANQTEQLTASIGVLGAIAGYLFGTTTQRWSGGSGGTAARPVASKGAVAPPEETPNPDIS